MVAVADAGTLLRDAGKAMKCGEGKASVRCAAWTASVAAGRCAPPAGWGWIDRGSTNHRSVIEIIRYRQKKCYHVKTFKYEKSKKIN